jgi:hypothetical protein
MTSAMILKNSEVTMIERALDGSSDFTSLVQILGLVPGRDFRHANLSGVDFSFSDLRGFDFTGADLSGCIGVSVLFDDSTIFTDADVAGSCFQNYLIEREHIARKPQIKKAISVLQEAEALLASDWIHSFFRNRGSLPSALRGFDKSDARVIFRKLMLSKLDLTKRVDIFFYLETICESREEFRSLILDILARCFNEDEVVLKFVSIAAAKFSNDRAIFDTIFKMCSDPREKVRGKAFLALLRSKFAREQIAEISDIFFLPVNSKIRKVYLFTRAIELGRKFVGSINLEGELDNLDSESILEDAQIFDRRIAQKIAEAQLSRLIINVPKGAKWAVEVERRVAEIVEQQEEIVFSTPFYEGVMRARHPKHYEVYRSRRERKKRGS